MRYRGSLILAIAFALLLVFSRSLVADVRLPAIFTDNAVLQRDIPVPVWGWADQGEQVTVKIGDQTKTAVPDAKTGKWTVKLDPLSVGDPQTITVSGKNTITLKNVLVGEVWICSGQSNMQMAVKGTRRAEEEIAAANFPKIRLVSVPTRGCPKPQDDFNGRWVECSPQTVGGFSAAGYFFGRELFKTLNVPIGLIHCSYGGSSCESWVNRSVLDADPSFKPMLERYDRELASYSQESAKAKYEKQMADWKKAVAKAKAAGKEVPKPPRGPSDPHTNNQSPANLYNGMLHPVLPYGIRGAIWYQGETNAGRAYQYRTLFPTLIKSWRAEWQQGEFPFYFVQLANYMATKPEPSDSAWAELREAQSLTLKVPATGQAVIIDIGEARDIHPKNKQDVGKRLALWALAKTYGKEMVYSGPVYKSQEIQGDKVVLTFDSIGGGLVAKEGDQLKDAALKGFAIAGSDKKFVWADARIEGDKILVSSSKVKSPVAVRYAWADNPECNLYNRADLPASPFRTDDWPGITVGKE
jgi:sialate O-acetylesterase